MQTFHRLLWVTVGIFLLQAVFSLSGSVFIEVNGALSSYTLVRGYFWTPLTYVFLHASLWHLLWNVVMMYFIGGPLFASLSRRNFWTLFVAGALFGALFWLPLHWHQGALMGMSTVALAMLSYMCCHESEQHLTLILIVFPITISKRAILGFVSVVELVSLLIYELPGRAAVANSAHLGALLAGVLCYAYHRGNFYFLRQLLNLKIKSKPCLPKNCQVETNNREALRREVDAILDKINVHGFGSLTPQERAILDKARDWLRR